MKLAIHFDIHSLEQLIKHFKYSYKKVYTYLQELDGKLIQHDMSDFLYNNIDHLIDNVYGKAALIIVFNSDGSGFNLWNYKNGVYIGGFRHFDHKIMHDILDKVSSNFTMCNECHKWIPNEAVLHYSFAGGVCPDCYNPKKHLPPDTRGD